MCMETQSSKSKYLGINRSGDLSASNPFPSPLRIFKEHTMKRIPLTTPGFMALVDDEDYERVMQYRWRVKADRKKKRHLFYAQTGDSRKGTNISLHRYIMATPKGMDTDHLNGIPLDCRKGNMRICTRRENLQNLHIQTASEYPGVSWHKRLMKWRADIRIDGQLKYLGLYENELDAAIAYRDAVKQLENERDKDHVKANNQRRNQRIA